MNGNIIEFYFKPEGGPNIVDAVAEVEEEEERDLDKEDIEDEYEAVVGTLREQKPTLRYRNSKSIFRCYYCMGKKISPWNISVLLSHARGIAARYQPSQLCQGQASSSGGVHHD